MDVLLVVSNHFLCKDLVWIGWIIQLKQPQIHECLRFRVSIFSGFLGFYGVFTKAEIARRKPLAAKLPQSSTVRQWGVFVQGSPQKPMIFA